MSTPPGAPPRSSVVRGLLPNLVWEAVLLAGLVGVAVTARAVEPQMFQRGVLWTQIGTLGLLAVGFALSLRTATPNLAVGALSMSGALWFADMINSDMSLYPAMAVAVLLCALIGLALGVIAGLTSVPAWALTLGAAAILQGSLLAVYERQVVPLRDREVILRSTDFPIWAVVVVLLSVGGGILFAVPAVRRLLTANRTDGGDPTRFSGRRLVGALVGLTGSSALAGLAGVLLTRYAAAAVPTTDALTLTAVLGIALLGGVSVYGRRAGIAGTLLALALFVVVRHWLLLSGSETTALMILAGLTVVVGLLASWLIDLIGRALSPAGAGGDPAGPGPGSGPGPGPGYPAGPAPTDAGYGTPGHPGSPVSPPYGAAGAAPGALGHPGAAAGAPVSAPYGGPGAAPGHPGAGSSPGDAPSRP